MDIRQIQYFITVCETLNFTEASKKLFVTQSAVSYQIASLEQELGLNLLNRDKHSVTLTPAGEVLLSQSYQIMDQLNEAVTKTKQASAGTLGHLNIATLGTRTYEAFPQLLERFHKTYPDVALQFEMMNITEMTEGLEKGLVDIGFIRSLSIQNNSKLEWQEVSQDYFCVVVRKDHPFSRLDSLDPSAIAGEDFITINRQREPGLFDMTINLCMSHGFSPHIVYTPGHIDTILCMVEAGLGIALVPHRFLNLLSPNLVYIPLIGNDIFVDLAVTWNKKTTNQSVALFLDILDQIKEK